MNIPPPGRSREASVREFRFQFQEICESDCAALTLGPFGSGGHAEAEEALSLPVSGGEAQDREVLARLARAAA